jgi:hypothetical protein
MLSDCEQRANSVNKSGRAHFNMRRPVDTRKYQRGPGNTRKYAINTVDTCEHRKTLSHPIPRPPIRANTRPPRIILPPCLQPSVSIIDSTPPGWVSHSFALLVINPLFSLRLHSFSLSYHPLYWSPSLEHQSPLSVAASCRHPFVVLYPKINLDSPVRAGTLATHDRSFRTSYHPSAKFSHASTTTPLPRVSSVEPPAYTHREK